MKKFTYWLNYKSHHDKELVSFEANSILDADKFFEEKFPEYTPVIKFPFIGVTILCQ